MVRIAISREAMTRSQPRFRSGPVAVEPYFNERGERVVWLELWVDRLGVMRGPGGELQRRHHAAVGGQ